MFAVVDMHVASTNADPVNTQKHLARAGLGLRYVAVLNRSRRGHHSLSHGAIPSAKAQRSAAVHDITPPGSRAEAVCEEKAEKVILLWLR
jgi:hypothetical protein